MNPFPQVQRVKYKHNPIHRLTCEYRFPTILKINEKEIADFQETIRTQYPVYKQSIGHQNQLKMIVSESQEDELVSPIFSRYKTINHMFFSEDNNYGVNLNSTSLSVSTQKYQNWEDFSPRINTTLETFKKFYKPAFYERIGLKYVDIIHKSKLNIDKNTEWKELIQPQVLGFLNNPELTQYIKSYTTNTEIKIGNGAMAQIQAYLATATETKENKPASEPEIVFIIVSDLFALRTEITEASNCVDYLHSTAYDLFRFLITEKLHNAMVPN
ncbi:MAG: TIGR04255 family protein [Candidatus Bathyarchaeota archaeon]|nr:TIGR04255 family protein [Candidatus Termiticorpusculum sp.]